MEDKITGLLEGGLALVRENSAISVILSLAGIMAVLFMFKGLLEDLERAVGEWLFWRWLKKDGNFLKFSTEGEARAGYAHYIDSRKYAAMTRGWRRRYEKKHGIQPEKQALSLREKTAKLKASLLDFWEALDYLSVPGLDDIREWFAARLKRKSAPKVSLEKNPSGKE